ncbi:MAG: restriction endonuclease [Candidatus Competibacteraceae bacterium]|nr:restriction endonuclease [Candidatus Competibacteraceae bacterium]MCB1820716.1 restriction endonuclease [Candidatus Competibacteraceae bacterium]
MSEYQNIDDALQILSALGLPRAQQNERSALCLLALLNLTPQKTWSEAENPLVGITPMMNFSRKHYGKAYAPNTRETFRRQTMHQLVDAGIALYNPDHPARPTNSPKTVYQIAPKVLETIRKYGASAWDHHLADYLSVQETLAERYARERNFNRIPIQIAPDQTIQISPGEHSHLIKDIVEKFGPCFVPGGILIYAGDTGEKWGYFDKARLASLGVTVDAHGKMPDVVLHDPRRNWLFLIESVTSHGPVDGKRHDELTRLFASASAGLVYVTAFPSRNVMARYLADIAWETEVWVADAPSHLIHFNGERLLGPYPQD